MSFKDQYASMYNLHAEAPDLLLKKISELSNTLEAARQNPVKNQKAISFYESILATMKYAWAYMEDLNFVNERILQLNRENTFLMQQLQRTQDELMKYRTVEHLKVSGEFDAVVKAVDEHLKGLQPTTNHNER